MHLFVYQKFEYAEYYSIKNRFMRFYVKYVEITV